jgi:hypothetical protein
MDKSKIPPLTKKSSIFSWGSKKKKKAKKRGGVGGVLDAVAERNRRLKEAAGN